MSANLAKMLGKPEAQVAKFIEQMEDKFCYPSHDVRLLAEIAQATKQKTAELGLDPQDTTGEELYHALRAKFARDSKQIDRAIGLNPSMDFERRAAKASQLLQHFHAQDELWVLKPTAAKALLRVCPPKKTMARLNFRSLESMLKRADIRQLLLVAPYLEPSAWKKTFAKYSASSSAADYELRPVNFVSLKSRLYQNAPGPSDFLAISKISGSVGLWPTQGLNRASGLHLILLLLSGLDELGIATGPEALASAHPALNWWAHTSHLVALDDGHPISFNLKDVGLNYLNGADFSSAAAYHGAAALWAELMKRYAVGAELLLPELEAVVQTSVSKLTVPTTAQLAEELANV